MKRRASGDRAAEAAQSSGAAVLDQSYEMVAIADLKPHPKNARKSDNAAIDASIAGNGFYGAVCVQRSSGLILAGKHRWERAQAAGMLHIPVLWLDVDDKAALKILAADNRTSDRAGYDEQALSELLTTILSECGSFEGSGYVAADFDKIIADMGDEIMREAKERVSKLAPKTETQSGGEESSYREQWLVLVRCKDEAEQLTLLERFSADGLECSAMSS